MTEDKYNSKLPDKKYFLNAIKYKCFQTKLSFKVLLHVLIKWGVLCDVAELSHQMSRIQKESLANVNNRQF